MIRNKLVFSLLHLMCFACSAQTGSQSVRELLAEQQNAWNRGDIAAFMEHYWKHDSLKFIGSKGVTYGWQKTFDNYRKAYPTKEDMGKLTFTLIEVSELSDSAVYVIGRWQLEKVKPAGGHFTLLWRKMSGNWVIVSDHTS